ncbi:MAG: branched-chain amino acid ABC transporter permease [Candidatus Eremiobacteraeota bacterium]|nr:branched-chain amino acid ABC transporter permease [Candidatus Eremiobacteraeota bacterium]
MSFLRPGRLIAFFVAAVVLALVPLFAPAYVSFQLSFVAAYAIAILGLIVLTGKNGQISLGHGAFVAVGGYTVAILAAKAGAPYWLAVIVAGGVSGLVGIAIGIVALRLEGVYLALATFALAVSVPSVLKRFGSLTGGSGGLVLAPIVPPASIDSEKWFYYVAWLVAGALIVLTAVLLEGRLGRALRAIRDNEVAAVSFGVNPYYYKTLAFAWSATYAGISGGLGAIATAFVSPDTYNFALSVTILVGAVLGGLETLWGAIAGGAVIEFLPLWAQKINAAAPSVVYGVALIAVMLAMPGGIAGTLIRLFRRRERPSESRIVGAVTGVSLHNPSD